jgi:RNA recognition motif-containing protein
MNQYSPVCKFWRQGICRFGDQCRYLHYETTETSTPSFAPSYYPIQNFSVPPAYPTPNPQPPTSKEHNDSLNVNNYYSLSPEEEAFYEENTPEEFLEEFGEMLYVEGLDKTVNEKQLLDFFGSIGPVAFVGIDKDPVGTPVGSAFVSYINPDDAEHAFNLLQGEKLPGLTRIFKKKLKIS